MGSDESKSNGYTIVIKLDEGGGDANVGKAVATAPSGDSAQSEEKKVGRKKRSSLQNGAAYLRTAPVAYALRAANTIAVSNINRISLKTGHTTLQEKTSFKYSAISSGVGILSSAVFGGITSGNPVGAVVGAVGAIASIGVNYIMQAQTMELEKRLDGINVQQANIRAGSAGNRFGNP